MRHPHVWHHRLPHRQHHHPPQDVCGMHCHHGLTLLDFSVAVAILHMWESDFSRPKLRSKLNPQNLTLGTVTEFDALLLLHSCLLRLLPITAPWLSFLPGDEPVNFGFSLEIFFSMGNSRRRQSVKQIRKKKIL